MSIPADVVERTQRHEGMVLWPYLDTAKDGPRVTIGVGHMVPTLAAFKALPLVGPDGQSPSAAEVDASWSALQGMVADQTTHGYKAEHFESATSVRIGSEDAANMLSEDLEVAVAALKKAFPAYDGFPDPAKAALIDLMFNIGATKFVQAKWPALFAAVWAVPPHWKIAAAESSRKPPIRDGRNKEIKELFEEAAKIQGVP